MVHVSREGRPTQLGVWLPYHQADGILPVCSLQPLLGLSEGSKGLKVGLSIYVSPLSPFPAPPYGSLHYTDGPVRCCPASRNRRIKTGNTCGHREFSQRMRKLRLLLADSAHFGSLPSALETAPKSLKGHPITKFTEMSPAVRKKKS